MKRIHPIMIALVVGLALCGLWALRGVRQTAIPVQPGSKLRAPKSKPSLPLDKWQDAIRADLRTDYTVDPVTTRRLMEKLSREELRQRPQEGRN